MFGGNDPFADFTDSFGGRGSSRAISNSAGGGSWDVKITKVKKADGTIVVERTDGRTGQTIHSSEGGGTRHNVASDIGSRRSSGVSASATRTAPRMSEYHSYQSEPRAVPVRARVSSNNPDLMPAAGGMASFGGGIERSNWSAAPVVAGGEGGAGGQRGAFVNWSS